MAAALHDGVGSQLVQLLRLSERLPDQTIHRALQRCLLELRLIVDSMDVQDESLALLMGKFRYRLQPVFDRLGMSLHWNVRDSEQPDLLPRGLMASEIMAILQEAVSNVLQHANAHAVWITLTIQDHGDHGNTHLPSKLRHACLKIEDDGQGMAAAAPHKTVAQTTGMGLLNMHRRAHAIGARLEIQPRLGGGTHISLSW